MLITENKVLRNLQEQVAKNKSDISDILEAKAVIAEFGIRVVGEVDTEAELPDPATYSGEYGDAYTVGTQTPYDYYIFTRPNDDIPQAHWFNVGQFPMPGPQGEPGLPGAKGEKGSMIYTKNINPTLVTGYNIGDLWINTKDNALFQLNNKGWDRVGYIKGDTGPQGPKGDKGDTGAPGTPINIVGVLSTVDLLPNPATVNKTTAYLVGESAPYPLYVIVGELDDKSTWTWQQLAVGGGGADITANIEVASSVNDVLSAPKKKLCILSNTSNLSFKVDDKIGGGSEELSTLSEVLPQGLVASCSARYNDNIYIFGGYNGSYLKTIYKFNCTTKIITTLSITLPQVLGYACCSIYNDNIYIFGGENGSYLKTIYKFNCQTETIETLSVTLPQTLSRDCCSIHNDNIYIFGGLGTGDISKNIYRFNCTNETISKLSVTLPKQLYGHCCSIHNDNIFIFGGFTPVGNEVLNTIYKFDCINETIITLSSILPQQLYYISCSIHNDNVYIFGGYNGSSIVNTIYKFNCINESITTLSSILSQRLYYVSCSTYNSNIYIFGGSIGGGNYSKAIYNFSVSFELAANNVLIYNANSNYSFDLITNQVTIPIKNIYIGDSTNTAQLANAYLYDESKTGWVNVNTGAVLTE